MYKLLLLLSIGLAQAITPTSYLTPSDKDHLRQVLETSWSLQELQQVFFSSGGFKHLKINVPNKENVCKFSKNSLKDDVTLENLYYASSIGKFLECPSTPPPTAKEILVDNIYEGASPQDLFYTVSAASNFGIDFDHAKVLRAMQHSLKKDDSVLSLGYAFHVGSQLKGDISSIFERIEDAIVQADELDGTMLQFEGGLSITALLISGAYKLSETAKRPIPLKTDQVIKFSNYLMSRKTVQIPKGAYYLLEAVTMLTNNKYHIPVSMSLQSNVAVSSESPKVLVKIANLMGEDLGPLRVSATTATEEATGAVMFTNKQLTNVSGKKSVYELDVMSSKPSRGFYKLSLNAEGGDSRLIGNLGTTIAFKVLASIKLKDVEFGTADSDQSTPPTLERLAYPSKLKNGIEVDQHQKVILKFTVEDSDSGKSTKVHQAFIKLTHMTSKREIIFVAEADTNNIYKFDMDISVHRKMFGGINGKYALDLIIGDPSISNPLVWGISDVIVSFPDGITEEASRDMMYKVKPAISHTFQSPDPRPPKMVSMTFTGLCLFPLILLIIIWNILNVNFSNFILSWSTIGFHLGLGAIFGLFWLFWLKLNMFTTLKYLLMISVVTFFCGNSMLSKIAARRKESK